MGEKMKRFMREQSNREADEIMAMIDQDPEMADVHAPDELGAALFAQIDEYEKSKTHNLSEEEKELIELGKVYKKRRKARKYVAVAAVAVMAMTFGGVTVMGGPEKMMEKVEEMLAGREQTVISSDDERIEDMFAHNEDEAYEKIDEEFGVYPVKLDYLPEGISLYLCEINKETQCINFIYLGENDKTITYVIRPNYKVGSTGNDVEDILEEEEIKEVSGIKLTVKTYRIKENDEKRYFVEFSYQNVYYILKLTNLDKHEVNNILENLYFN